MKLLNIFSIIIIAGTALLSSCIKKKDYPPTPVIEFKDFVKFGNNDSADFVIYFKDGDGDIGLDQKDTLHPFAPTDPYHHNLILNYFYQNDSGNYVKYYNPIQSDTLVYKYRVPNITPKGQNKILEGDIHVKLYAPISVPGHTSIRFEVILYDRALHKSNVITTPDFIME